MSRIYFQFSFSSPTDFQGDLDSCISWQQVCIFDASLFNLQLLWSPKVKRAPRKVDTEVGFICSNFYS